jgi:hypothetical protein
MRDIAEGDFVSWINQQLAAVDDRSPDRLNQLCAAIVEPLSNVYGLADKVLAIGLSPLLMALGRRKPSWFAVGTSLIAVDIRARARRQTDRLRGRETHRRRRDQEAA